VTDTRCAMARHRFGQWLGWRSAGLERLCLLALLLPVLSARLVAQTQAAPQAQPAPAPPAASTPGTGSAPALSVQDLNAMLVQARADVKAGNTMDAIDLMTKAVGARPDLALLWVELGNDYMADTAILKKDMIAKNLLTVEAVGLRIGYDAAESDYKKATGLNATPAVLANAYAGLADAEVKLGQLPQAHDDYAKAAQLYPAGAAVYTANEAIDLYDLFASGQSSLATNVVEAADAAIAVDPNSAILYYIKASGLDPTVTNINSPNRAALVEACNHYLQLDPTGPYAAEVRKMLTGEVSQPPNTK
jgi:tetratricopeptide (TPR) repeat protein